MRTEHDFLGDMAISDGVRYGIQTARALGASDVTGHSLGEDGMDVVGACALVKKAAALANADVGGLDRAVALAIAAAADEVMAGRWNGQFPVDMITGGGGISIHMNINEVLANRASEILGTGVPVRPLGHVNMGQSTNDVLPSAILIACRRRLGDVVQAVEELAVVVAEKERAHVRVVRLGRTCLQDALPVTAGQTFSAWRSFLARQARMLGALADDCLALPLGGTAVGTGAGTLPGYVEAVYARLRQLGAGDVRPADNGLDALQFDDVHVRLSAALKALSGGAAKMAADLRLLSSGPRGGLGEVILPVMLPGSSIMPGKVNPVLPELVMQVHFLVCGNDTAVTLAAGSGELELNVWEAVVARCNLDSCRLVARALRLFARRCVAGLLFDEGRCRALAEASTGLCAIVAAVFGHETGARVAKAALKSGRSVGEEAVAMGLMDAGQAARLLDPELATDGERLALAVSAARAALVRPPKGGHGRCAS